MNTNISKKFLTLIAVVAILAVASYAAAGWGGGYRGHHMDGWGYGPQHDDDMGGYGMRGYGPHHDDDMGGYGMMGYGPRGGTRDNLTREQIEALDQQREAFYQATSPLRESLYEKQLALRAELAKENPDAAKAADLQREISKLKADFDQKQLEHRLKLRSIAPTTGRGPGYGPRGGGYCWR